MPNLPDNMLFLTAPRFWVMILGALSIYLEAKGWIGEPERNLIATISAVFIGVQTLDRASEHVGKTETEAKEDIKEEKKLEGGV